MDMHIPVLLKEVVDLLDLREGRIIVDATVGGGGHASAILSEIGTSGVLIAIDEDKSALEIAKQNLKEYPNVYYVNANFADIEGIVQSIGFGRIDGVLFDLGVSSFQLSSASRGFSFAQPGQLDMRMSMKGTIMAKDIINTYSEGDLYQIFRNLGEERFAKQIATEIVKARKMMPLETTSDLVEIIARAIPIRFRIGTSRHFATNIFRALRMVVNNEIENIRLGLDSAYNILKKGGRIVVLTYHSIEDHEVKQVFYNWRRGCSCPPKQPVCTCQKKKAEIITKKPIFPSEEEINFNPRSRSAKLRAVIKV